MVLILFVQSVPLTGAGITGGGATAKIRTGTGGKSLLLN